jgi:hypothetical protein
MVKRLIGIACLALSAAVVSEAQEQQDEPRNRHRRATAWEHKSQKIFRLLP